MVGEAAELLEIFQWLTEKEAASVTELEEPMGQVKDEIGDVMDYLLRLSDVLGVDLDQAGWRKIKKNAIKYPANPIRE